MTLTRWTRAVAAGLAVLFSLPALADTPTTPSRTALQQQVEALGWQRGPATVPLGTRARITIPTGVRYLDSAGTARFLTLTGNLSDDHSFTVAADDFRWFTNIDFDETGYVKDDERLDQAKLLTTLRESEGESNKARAEKHLDTLTTLGWAVPPHYDPATHNLEWGTKLRSSDGQVDVNYAVRLLGRSGVMRVILVSDPEQLDTNLADFRRVFAGFTFASGERYADHQSGDKVAEYGLAALVTGGAAAVIAKTGFGALLIKGLLTFIKPLLIGVAALFAALRGRIARLFRRRGEPR